MHAVARTAMALAGGRTHPAPRSPWPDEGGARRAVVRALRLAFPAAAALLLATLVIWPYVASAPDRLRLVASLPQADLGGENDAIIAVTLTGTDRAGRPYTLVAAKIRPLDPARERLALTAPELETTTRDGRPLRAVARAGSYDQRRQVVDLEGAVRFALDRSHRLETERARLDLATNTAEGSEPVAADGPFGRLTAQGFRIGEGGDLVLFTGSARLTTTERGAGAGVP